MTDLTDDGDDRDEQALEEDGALGAASDAPDVLTFLSTPTADEATSDQATSDDATSDDAASAAVAAGSIPDGDVPDGDVVITEDELLGGGVDDYDDADDEPVRESPYDRPGSWYVVHTYAGYENKVKSNLESRINSMDMEDRIFECVIPM